MTGEMGFRGQFARQQSCPVHVRFGSKADIARDQLNVRFTPKSGHRNSLTECPLCANSGLMHCSNLDPRHWAGAREVPLRRSVPNQNVAGLPVAVR